MDRTGPLPEPQALNASSNLCRFLVSLTLAILAARITLKKRGLRPIKGFVVLDQSPQPGGAWQYRWPSLTLSTVNRIHDLPGMRFSEAVDTDATEVQANVAVPQYFAEYEKRFELPVYRPVTVQVVCDRGDRLRIETDRFDLSARGIINATGTRSCCAATTAVSSRPAASRRRLQRTREFTWSATALPRPRSAPIAPAAPQPASWRPTSDSADP